MNRLTAHSDVAKSMNIPSHVNTEIRPKDLTNIDEARYSGPVSANRLTLQLNV